MGKKRNKKYERYEGRVVMCHSGVRFDEKRKTNWKPFKPFKPFEFIVQLMVGLVLLTFAAAVVIEGVSATREMNDRPTDTITPDIES